MLYVVYVVSFRRRRGGTPYRRTSASQRLCVKQNHSSRGRESVARKVAKVSPERESVATKVAEGSPERQSAARKVAEVSPVRESPATKVAEVSPECG